MCLYRTHVQLKTSEALGISHAARRCGIQRVQILLLMSVRIYNLHIYLKGFVIPIAFSYKVVDGLQIRIFYAADYKSADTEEDKNKWRPHHAMEPPFISKAQKRRIDALRNSRRLKPATNSNGLCKRPRLYRQPFVRMTLHRSYRKQCCS